MRTVSAAMQAHLQQPVTTLAMCFLLTRKDGETFGFTDHDRSLVIDGETYAAHTGFIPTTIELTSNLSVDNMEVEALFDDPRITEQEVRARLFDHATVEYFQVNWRALSMGKNPIKAKSTLGELRRTRYSVQAEVRGPSQAVQQTVGEVLLPTCRADLGDERCTVDLAAITVTGTVTVVGSNNRRNFASDDLEGIPGGHFTYGLLTWTSGGNTGISIEVKKHTSTHEIALFQKMPKVLEVGDEYSLYSGCDKRWDTCVSKYSNSRNFQGEPDIIGEDELFRIGTRYT